jgi:hypothetical protein
VQAKTSVGTSIKYCENTESYEPSYISDEQNAALLHLQWTSDLISGKQKKTGNSISYYFIHTHTKRYSEIHCITGSKAHCSHQNVNKDSFSHKCNCGKLGTNKVIYVCAPNFPQDLL